MNSSPSFVPEYRSDEVLVRNLQTNGFESTDPRDYEALVAPPAFAAGWWMQALEHDPAASILTASINSSDWCPIWENRLCGRYCFAWNAGSKWKTPYPNLDAKYLRDMRKLAERGANVGIFYSYDVEPFAGAAIIETTKAVLRAVMEMPPTALLVHTRTAHAIDPDLRALLKDTSQAVGNFIVGVGVETDVEELWPHRHYHSVDDRLRSIELMSNDGIQTQWTTTPMIWYRDYPGLIKRLREIWAGRIMLGRLKYTLPGWGAEAARELDNNYWLHIPTEEEALAICAAHKFPHWANTRERFYVSMWNG